MNNNKLINELIEISRSNKSQALGLLQMEFSKLNWKEHPESWSILECIEHLNRYADFYLPEVNRVLDNSSSVVKINYKPGWLGNHFAKSMKVKPKLNKMKTFKSMNPSGSNLQVSCLEKYISYQDDWQTILEKCRNYDLGRLRTNITISNWIKLKLGDTLRVVIFHEERHIAQIQRIKSHLPHSTSTTTRAETTE